MARTSRLLVLAVAWAVPVCWTVLALLAGPSDGTSLSSRLVPSADSGWGDTVRVATTYGETPLRPGDEVQAVDGRSPAQWVADADGVRRQVGDIVRYEVRRTGAGLDLIQQVDVTLHRYPFAAAARSAPHVVLLPVLLLAVGSLVFWTRPSAAAARAFLVATALLPAATTSTPLGLGVIDLAGARGAWPQLVGEAVAAVGLVALLLSVALLTRAAARDRWVTIALLAVPVLAYAVWLGVRLGSAGSALERLSLWATVFAPVLWAAVPVLLVVATLAYLRARDRTDVLATRLALLGVGAGVAAWLVLGPAPALLTGAPLLRQDLLVLLGGALALAGIAAAAGHYHLAEIEPRVRRGLVQALVLVVVAAAFVGMVRAVDAAADISVGSMLAGGLLALLLLPAAVAVQRTVRRVVYGDREFPHRVVSDLRRLDALTAPEDALREALELLARRLHLSFAAVDVLATPTSGPVAASIGAPLGTPATVDLSVGGTTVGRLRLEVDAGHDPFGPGDRRLLEDVGTQVGALVQAVTANRELQVSRQRLVAAREEERRRLRRDLHDGLGPSLASLAMRLEAATDLIEDDPEQAADLVGRLSDQAREGIGEVRRLVEGLRPPALDQLGLVSALRHRAAEHGAGVGTVPWTVEAADDIEPLPAAVEVAAYRIVVEAVTNAQRHSGADRCVVRLSRDAGDLRIEVSDTGSGLAADRRPGVGLSSMRERAEELGGTFEAGDRPGGGTVVRVRLPLQQG
ncbi:sensor histidine kinase [Nocardioides sp. zg-1230]|uniref:sensor histidine kinase n=1 Tax=Nocardioides sp. zg-1230 TaxID=2736601 RepID=UPI0015517C57|nr:sensor histidine kinase [Nocardioides sp. zg-1230]NPC43259.1 sensor histidine kinase [Nocardioides sp. zg-1230]NPC44837.1 sensor histidine kinase [Nocardioides sp. zg-1230]